jgi:hypothetical protein
MKYPRTYHLPYSPGATKDDKKLQDDWFNYFEGEEIVITEKLDGENTAFTSKDVYARSHGAPTRSPWSRNLWDNDGLYWKVKPLLLDNEIVFGENLYGEHSIHYNKLSDYWYMFAEYDEVSKRWASWDFVKYWAKILNVPTVPELWRGVVTDENSLKTLVDFYTKEPSIYGDKREGVVIRVTKSFSEEDFSHNVCKWVRKDHVTTSIHWTKTWKVAKLIS